jgi:hypothetical protein
MRQQELLNEARDLLAQFVTRVKGSTAMGHTDINVISEAFLTELLREVFSLPALRNLNQEKRNFPGLDLADDTAGVGYQVTATPELSKIKDSLQTSLDAGLHAKYPRIRIYILTEKQASYSQAAIDAVTRGRVQFDASRDVQDYRDVLRACTGLQLNQLERVVALLRNQLSRSGPASGAKGGVNLLTGVESVELNLVPIWFPNTLYIADFVLPNAPAGSSGVSRPRRRRPLNLRQIVAKDIMNRGFDVPEDFEVHTNQVVSFHDPSAHDSLLRPYVDAGTLTPITPKGYYAAVDDDDQLNVFKSLLRRAFQRQMRQERIHWQEEKHLFFYGPVQKFDERMVLWKEERAAMRTVFQKKMKKNKPDEILTCKHLAFYVDFHLIEDAWYMAITPTWYFSRDGYRPDGFSAKRISWLKAQENDQQVHTHFRFICHRIREVQEGSLFDGQQSATLIQIGEAVSFPNHPFIPDQLWKPPSQPAADDPDRPFQANLAV